MWGGAAHRSALEEVLGYYIVHRNRGGGGDAVRRFASEKKSQGGASRMSDESGEKGSASKSGPK